MEQEQVNLNGATVFPTPNGWYWGNCQVTDEENVTQSDTFGKMVGVEIEPEAAGDDDVCILHAPRKHDESWSEDPNKENWFIKEELIGLIKFYNF